MATLPDPAFWHGRRVLLTGHTGFKGAWLAAWLRDLGAEVTGFAQSAEPGSLAALTGPGVARAIVGDLRDAAAVRDAVGAAAPEVVLHLAAQSLVRRSYADPVETFATNVMGTVHLLDALRHAPRPPGAVVIVTSDKCYANNEWAWPYREDDRLGGHDPYSASKACAELVAASWRHAFADAGGAATIATARAGNVIGGGDGAADRLIPDCVRAFTAGEVVRLRNPAALRPWQHVMDPLCGYLLLAERLWHGNAPAAVNFGPASDEAWPVSAVVGQFARLWGDARWDIAEGPHPHEAGMLAVDASLARARLGWRPLLRVADAIAWTALWYRERMAGADAGSLVARDIAAYRAIGAAQ